jgi:hypothetical protein
MPVGKVMEQIIKCKDAEFFFQQIAPLRTYAFKVFDRMR